MSITFDKIVEDQDKHVLVIDALNLAFRWKHSGDTDFLDSYRRTVDSLRKSYKCGKVVIACDSGSSSYRKNILPTYKQNRKDKFETQTPEEKEAFEKFFTEFNRVIKKYEEEERYPVLRFDRCEADDIAAYIVKNRKHWDIQKIVLASSDKDWDLLITPDVMRFSYVTRKEVTWENWNEHYDYDQEHHISIKCLTGDSGDNVPGVQGIGPKKALSVIQAYGSVLEIAASLPVNSKYKYIANLNIFGCDSLVKNYQLMDLLEFCSDALGPDNCDAINNKLKVYI